MRVKISRMTIWKRKKRTEPAPAISEDKKGNLPLEIVLLSPIITAEILRLRTRGYA